MLDIGSQFTFITKELADTRGVEPTRAAQIILSERGNSEGVVTIGSLNEISIEGLDHNAFIGTEVRTLPEIFRTTNVKPHVQKEKYKLLKDLWFPDVSKQSEMEIHVLVGVNGYHRIVIGASRWGSFNQSQLV